MSCAGSYPRSDESYTVADISALISAHIQAAHHLARFYRIRICIPCHAIS